MSKRSSVVVYGDVTGSVIITGKGNTIQVRGKRRNISCPDRSVVVGGSIKDSVIVTGRGNRI